MKKKNVWEKEFFPLKIRTNKNSYNLNSLVLNHVYIYIILETVHLCVSETTSG